MKYEIKEFKMINIGLLEPHPDAMAYPSDDDDREIVTASTMDVGTLQPLIVIQHNKGTFLVLDGCGRLIAAHHNKVDELPCLVVECDNPRDLAMNINSAGRKRSTGSRVLCYLMANRVMVLKASEAAGGCMSRDSKGGKQPNRGEISEELKPWTINGISDRLGVSNKDVQMALELMVCHSEGVLPSVSVYGKFAPNTPMKEDCEFEAMQKAFVGVMSGRTPVRRWAAAFAGRVNTAGQGKAETNWACLFDRTLITLLNVIAHKAEIKWETTVQQQRVQGNFMKLFACLPEQQRLDLMDVISKDWNAQEKAALVKQLGGTPKK